MMFPEPGTGRNLFTSVFSDEPVPEVDAAIVVARPGEEAARASWLLVRFQQRASVYCLTKPTHGRDGETVAAAACAGIPAARCHNLGLAQNEFARDLEALVWLTTAAVSGLQPRVLVTHACEGKNLAHDATAVAVHLTAKLLTRTGRAAPLVVEFPSGPPDAEVSDAFGAPRQAVRIEFGPESRKVKRQMLRCHATADAAMMNVTLDSEAYVLASSSPLEALALVSGPYADGSGCRIEDFRCHARDVAASFDARLLATPSRV